MPYNPVSQLVTRHNTYKRHILTKPVMQSIPTKHPPCPTTSGGITKSPKLRQNSPCSLANGDKLSKFGQGAAPQQNHNFSEVHNGWRFVSTELIRNHTAGRNAT